MTMNTNMCSELSPAIAVKMNHVEISNKQINTLILGARSDKHFIW